MNPGLRERMMSKAGALSEERGSTMVEMALCSAVLFTFVFGIIIMSVAVYSYHFIAEAAREGTRYAIVRGSSAGLACTSYSSSGCIASSTDIQNYVKSRSLPGVSSAYMTVTPTFSKFPSGSGCTPSTSCNNPGDLVKVAVQYNIPVVIPFIPFRMLNLKSAASMVIAQ